jgi:type IV secretory pathway TrbD component
MLTPAPIYQSLTRPLQVAGAERTYAILVIGGTSLLGVLGWYFHSIVCGVSAFLLYSGGMLFLRRAAKIDPHMIEAAQRFYGYQKFYPARSAPNSKNSAQVRAAGAVMAGLFFGLGAWLFGSLLLVLPAVLLVGLGLLLLRNER